MSFVRVLFIIVCAGCAGRGCGTPPLDDTRVDTSSPETGETGETGVVQRCPVPEVEPNGAESEALLLPLETTGCGTFMGNLEIDYWLIEFEHSGWLSVSVAARSIGSPADPGMYLSSENGASAQVGDSTSGEDIEVVFPTGPDRFHAMLAEVQAGQGGEGHDYEIMASWVKSPVSYTTDEVEPNDTQSLGQPLFQGDHVFGWLNDSIDSDWYRLELPAGKQTVSLDVDSWEYGSAGDFKLIVLDSMGEKVGTWLSGEMGWEPDPLAVFSVQGNQTLYVRIAEERNRSSHLCWYVLRYELEGGDE